VVFCASSLLQRWNLTIKNCFLPKTQMVQFVTILKLGQIFGFSILSPKKTFRGNKKISFQPKLHWKQFFGSKIKFSRFEHVFRLSQLSDWGETVDLLERNRNKTLACPFSCLPTTFWTPVETRVDRRTRWKGRVGSIKNFVRLQTKRASLTEPLR